MAKRETILGIQERLLKVCLELSSIPVEIVHDNLAEGVNTVGDSMHPEIRNMILGMLRLTETASFLKIAHAEYRELVIDLQNAGLLK